MTIYKPIDGIRLTSYDGTVANGEIIQGGIGFNYVTVRVTANSYYLFCLLEALVNGEYTTSILSTTSKDATTEIPDEVVMEKGNTDEENKFSE